MHLSKMMVKKGDTVEKGQVIGLIGCTGSCTGPHLHLTVYKNGDLMNPFNLYK
jgi:murein DD-endopeptidase MepM/ murein hydrolase activator NlpD